MVMVMKSIFWTVLSAFTDIFEEQTTPIFTAKGSTEQPNGKAAVWLLGSLFFTICLCCLICDPADVGSTLSKAVAKFYQTMWNHIPKDDTLQINYQHSKPPSQDLRQAPPSYKLQLLLKLICCSEWCHGRHISVPHKHVQKFFQQGDGVRKSCYKLMFKWLMTIVMDEPKAWNTDNSIKETQLWNNISL